MKNQFLQPKGVENVSNMSQPIRNIIINDQKHILDLYRSYRGHSRKAPWPPLKKFPDIDQVLPNITGMFMWLSKTKSITFGRSKTLSNIFIWCPIASNEINTFCVCVWFHKFSTKSKKSHKLLISSEEMGHHMRMFDTVLERPKAILLVL